MYRVDLEKGPAIKQLHQMFMGDKTANRIGAYLFQGDAAVSPGGSCAGTAILNDGSTVPLTGTVAGNEIYIDLPPACYAVPGPIQVYVLWTNGTVATTVVAGFGNVTQTETDTVIDPGSVITISVAQLIALIEEVRASIPADYSDLLTTIAPTFSSSVAYTAGQYVWNEGTLYRFTVDHAAGSWIGTDAVAAVVGNDVAALKSDFDNLLYVNLYKITTREYKFIDKTTGNTAANSGYVLSDFIPVTAGTVYYAANILNVTWYKTDKSYNGYSDFSGFFNTVTAPADSAYARIQYIATTPHLAVFFSATNPRTINYKMKTTDNVAINPSYDSYDVVYARKHGTETVYYVDNNPLNARIPVYNANGNIKTSAPVENNDATRKIDLENALGAVNTYEGSNVQIINYGCMKDLYEKAGTSGQGTKAFLNDEIVFTPTSGRASAAYINYLMGSTTYPIEAYVSNPRIKNKITVDIWYSTVSTKYQGMIRCAENPTFWYFPLTVGTNMHTRFSLDLTDKTLQHIGVQYNATSTDDTEFITIRKIMVWYGESDYINPVVVAENSVRPIKYNKILSIGDSLTNVENPTGTKYVGDWQAKLANILHIPNRQKLGVAGTALSKFPASGEGSENSIYAKIQGLTADSSVDLITLWGGTNDWYSNITLSDFETQLPAGTRNDSTFYGGALTDIETLITKFPKARIVIVGTTPRSWENNTKNSRTTPNGNGKYLQEYNDALKQIAEYYGLAFIDLMKTSGINIMNITNYMVPQAGQGGTYYLHFNDLGEETIAKRLAYFINAIG
jgi:lysophospholipase L1-like esterase